MQSMWLVTMEMVWVCQEEVLYPWKQFMSVSVQRHTCSAVTCQPSTCEQNVSASCFPEETKLKCLHFNGNESLRHYEALNKPSPKKTNAADGREHKVLAFLHYNKKTFIKLVL